jgi:hypothetical protein
MNISIKVVPNKIVALRAGFTGADWWFDADGNLEVRVADEAGSWQEQTALAIHEAVEAAMCRHLGITVADVDKFDSKYQAEHEIDVNAGDEPDAPYKVPHTFATAIERVFTGVCGVDWKTYDQRLSKL